MRGFGFWLGFEGLIGFTDRWSVGCVIGRRVKKDCRVLVGIIAVFFICLGNFGRGVFLGLGELRVWFGFYYCYVFNYKKEIKFF